MIAPIEKVRGEGNCGRATDRGEEACECVRKYRPVFAVGHILVKAARLRTETSTTNAARRCPAGSGRRVCTTSGKKRCQEPFFCILGRPWGRRVLSRPSLVTILSDHSASPKGLPRFMLRRIASNSDSVCGALT